jgi:DNA (cytosine-5)-methyltransferase 1
MNLCKTMKIIDLFSGIGGFSLGLEATGGFETIQFVENEPWCQKILAKNFPGVPIAGDIREYDGQKADIVVGGFPCQPFSVAGKRKGTNDDRHLWPEMLRVIKACKPRWVIGENVRNLTSIQDGMVFEQVCTDLEEQGYEVQSFVIPASAVNAPHQRYRVWIVAYSENRGREQTEWKRRQGLERGSYDSGGIETERQEVVRDVANTQCDGLTSTKERGSIEETVREESQGQNRTLDSQGASDLSETKGNVANSKISERDALQTNREYGEASPQEVFRDRSCIQRQTSWWSFEPNVGRVAHGIPDRVDRLKGLGNAIVPQIAYQIGLAILQAEDEHSQVG